MAKNTDYLLTAAPKVIARNDSAGRRRGYVLTNLTALGTGQLLGEGEALGEGTAIAANDQITFELGPGEVFFAAAPDADAVSVRVMDWYSS